MQQITAYKTLDNTLFEHENRALRHAKARYANVLSELSHKLVAINKYVKMMETLDSDEVLDLFQALIALKADCELTYSEDPDDE